MKVNYEAGTRFTAGTRGHKVTLDLPRERGGTDQGMTPPELLAAAFGACIGVYVTRYCKQVGVNPDDTTVDVRWETVEEPMRISRLHATVTVPAGIPEGRRAAVKKVAEHCLIHRTLCAQPEMMIELA